LLIVDAHLDLAWNALQWHRNLQLSAHTIRMLEIETPGPGRSLGTTALPDLARGRVALCFATLLARSTGRPNPTIDYDTSAQAFAVARGQLAYYRALEKQGYVRIITDTVALDRHIAEWTAWDADPHADDAHHPPLGFIISMESADPILNAGELAEWREAGVRLIGPAHYGPGRYTGGTGTELGLTSAGRELLVEMERLGVILDTTHLTDQAFWEALKIYNGPIIASHNNCRALVPHQRQFTDEQIKAIIKRDGVIGTALDLVMLKLGWVIGSSSNAGTKLEMAVDHIDHICQLAGNTRHVAIGSDLDGGFGHDQSPQDVDTIADLQKFGDLLAKRGYSESDINGFMHGNWLRLIRRCWSSTPRA
jgi:membrane dipeptidase